ncbi:MAG: hypothetical protein N4A45_09265 [Flavobacteriales bacterium]|jgi:hypothetical protein|nr:hypothetical protein [Flavobacteriales bacterium]
MKKAYAIILLFIFNLNLNAQIGIGTSTPHSSAKLDVTSTTRGFLPTRMTTAQRDLINSPARGLVIFNITTRCLEFNRSSNPNLPDWVNVCGNLRSFNNCSVANAGALRVGVQATNITQTISATFTSTGAESITTDTVNGVFFRYSGNVNSGTHNIVLTAVGTPTTSGNHTYTIRKDGNTCSFSATVLNPLPCTTPTPTITGATSVVTGSSINLSVAPNNYANYVWSIQSGSGTLNTTTGTTVTLTPTNGATGNIVVRVVATGNTPQPCTPTTGQDLHTVTISPPPPCTTPTPTITGATSVVTGSSINLSVSPNNYANYVWSIQSGSGTLNTTTGTTVTLTPTNGATGNIVVRVVATGNTPQPCTPTTGQDLHTVTISQPLTLTASGNTCVSGGQTNYEKAYNWSASDVTGAGANTVTFTNVSVTHQFNSSWTQSWTRVVPPNGTYQVTIVAMSATTITNNANYALRVIHGARVFHTLAANAGITQSQLPFTLNNNVTFTAPGLTGHSNLFDLAFHAEAGGNQTACWNYNIRFTKVN